MSTTPNLPLNYVVTSAPADSANPIQYWVLDPAGKSYEAHAARVALMAYASAIKPTHPGLARTLIAWAEAETTAAALETA